MTDCLKIIISIILITIISNCIIVLSVIKIIEKHSIHPDHGHGILNDMSKQIDTISYKIGCSPEDSC